MKTVLFTLLLSLAVPLCMADDFKRDLPNPSLLKQLTVERFKNQDAIIILKEQAFAVHQSSIFYRGVEFTGQGSTHARILVAKMLTEAGARRYGSYEYTYPEWFGDEIRCGFEIHVRVMKEDGSIQVMPEEDVKKIVSREGSDGTPIERKVLFKIADLRAGDVIQIEQVLTEPLTRSVSGVFFYNDRDIVLFSNLSITLPAEDKVRYLSFPEERIGAPKVEQMLKIQGAGDTYFWSVKNLNAIPDEPYARPFEDQSLITAFVDDPPAANGYRSVTDWNSIAKNFADSYLDKDAISAAHISELGFAAEETNVTLEKTDRLYESLRKAISLRPNNSLYPLSEDIEQVFTKKTGDASDLAYIMYTILNQWKQNANVVWIRDKRDGVYEQQVPTVRWFDRMGVLVKIGDKEKVYDFDRSIPARYDMPWFLSGITVPVVSRSGCRHIELHDAAGVGDHYTRERHLLHFSKTMSLTDSTAYECKGAVAERYRDGSYEDDRDQLQSRLRSMVKEYCLASQDTAWCNQILDEPVAEMHFVGTPKTPSTQVESFVTLRLNNFSLDKFYQTVATATRISDFILDEPSTMSIAWKLDIPKGYALHQCLENATVSGPCGMTGAVNVTKNAAAVDVSMEVHFPTTTIPQADFKQMVGFLEKMKSAVGKDVVLKKL